MRKIIALFTVLFILLLSGCENAQNNDGSSVCSNCGCSADKSSSVTIEKEELIINTADDNESVCNWEEFLPSSERFLEEHPFLKNEKTLTNKGRAATIARQILREKQENGEWLGYNMISITHYTQRNEWLIAYSHAVDTPTNGKRSIFMAVNILIDGNDCSRIATEACE